ncbi:MarR family winged helix-turn-helix transcriptional regulator [Yinghuangia soli]|uniref:MarR family transcriptional regulator n=1 Tax=Yinghuangia soli TaxID=2908204 RepID=A0AA41Q5R8_9ACTN|nr:MarR family transcriptional regulator [Yinghuangia soli]MCF2532058.1 MarR family transcriptional regulator [Yinghuangia soli]
MDAAADPRDPGAGLIEAVLRLRRSSPSRLLQAGLYAVGDTQLTPAQVDALECLAGRPLWRMHELAKHLNVEPSTATRTVDPLVRLGLAEREPDPVNRRYVVVQASTEGKAVARRIVAARLALMRDVLGPMPVEDRAALTELLTRYVDLIEAYAERTGR